MRWVLSQTAHPHLALFAAQCGRSVTKPKELVVPAGRRPPAALAALVAPVRWPARWCGWVPAARAAAILPLGPPPGRPADRRTRPAGGVDRAPPRAGVGH